MLRHGAAASFMFEDRGPRMVDTDNDNRAAGHFRQGHGPGRRRRPANAYPAPLASAAEQLYLAGRRAGLGRGDDSSVIEILRGTASAST